MSSLPTQRVDGGPVFLRGQEEQGQLISYEIMAADYDFIGLMGLEIISGRNFSQDFTTDAAQACILNEKGAKLLGDKDPLGKEIYTNRGYKTIIGIIKDAHFKSLRYNIDPTVIHIRADLSKYPQWGTILTKIRGEGTTQTIARMRNIWNRTNPGVPFEFHFLDEAYERLYHSERRLSTIFNFFSILAVLICCIGLLGLASFMAQRKTKEIGIRKILGASTGEILFLLSREFAKWILIANLIAWPVGYFVLNQWLRNFAYKTDLNLLIFPLAGLLTLVIALLTVGYQTVKAALCNPVHSLRYE